MELNFGVAAHNFEIQNGRHKSKIYCTVHSEIMICHSYIQIPGMHD